MAVVTALLLVNGAANAQTQSPAERRAAINRVIDGLNSPDPSTRLVTLESATSGRDLNIRRIALATAFASSDSILRGAALTAAIQNTPTFVVDLNQPREHRVWDATGGSFEVRVVRFDKGAGTFQAVTRFAKDKAYAGAVSGDRLSFEVSFPIILWVQCGGVARLQGTGSLLTGTMACTGNFNEQYDIKIDVLR